MANPSTPESSSGGLIDQTARFSEQDGHVLRLGDKCRYAHGTSFFLDEGITARALHDNGHFRPSPATEPVPRPGRSSHRSEESRIDVQ
jgi:hypothetical protein